MNLHPKQCGPLKSGYNCENISIEKRGVKS